MKYIAIVEVNEYADCDGGWQPPIKMKATNMQDAIIEAQAYVVKEGKANPRDREYMVGKLFIYEVTNEHDLDIEAINDQLPRTEYSREQIEKNRPENGHAQQEQLEQAKKDEEHRERLKKILDGSSLKSKKGSFRKKRKN